jgi:hypothetical protein
MWTPWCKAHTVAEESPRQNPVQTVEFPIEVVNVDDTASRPHGISASGSADTGDITDPGCRLSARFGVAGTQ